MWLSEHTRPNGLNTYQLHQWLWAFFADNANRPYIFREHREKILMLSTLPPACESSTLEIRAGTAYAFDVCVHPIKRDQETRREIWLKDYDQQREWLARQLKGCELRFAYTRSSRVERVKESRFLKVEMTGVLYVTDLMVFLSCLQKGVGKGKAWGCGMLYLPEIMK